MLAQVIGDRQRRRAVGQMPVGGKRVQRHEHRPRLDPVREEAGGEVVAADAQPTRIEHAGEHPGGDLRPVVRGPQRDAGNAAQAILVPAPDRAAATYDLVAALHLPAEDGRGDVGHPEVEADDREEVAAVGIHPLAAQHAEAALHVRILEGDRTAFAAGEHLVAVKREGGRLADAPHRPALVGGKRGLGRVFHHPQAVRAGHPHDRIHVGRLAEQVHHDDAAGARRDRRLDRVGGDAPRGGIDVDEHRLAAAIAHGVGGGDVGHRGHDHLVARLHVHAGEDEMERRRAVRHAEAEPRPARGGELPLEPREEGAARGDPRAADRLAHVALLVAAEVRGGDGNEGLAGGAAWRGHGMVPRDQAAAPGRSARVNTPSSSVGEWS